MITFEEAKEKINGTEKALDLFGIKVITNICVNCKHYFDCPVKEEVKGACINRCSFFVAPIEYPIINGSFGTTANPDSDGEEKKDGHTD